MTHAIHQEQPRRVGSWALKDKIGCGSFSVVWKGFHASTGQLAAVKEVATGELNHKLKESLDLELSILKAIHHTNIVQLYDIIKEGDRTYIVMEYCGGGDLYERIKRNGRSSESFARHCHRQLAAGLQELRKHNLVHRDLKPHNLLLMDSSQNPDLKIADFGFARSLQPQRLAETLCGSPLYMAPEILKFQRYDAKADLWSVGTILYELVVGRPPFDAINHLHLLQNIERNEVHVPNEVRKELSLECQSLIHRLLKRNPVERITFEEYFSDPFIITPGEATYNTTIAQPTGVQNSRSSKDMALSMVKEESCQRRLSAGEGSSAATVVHVGHGEMDETMESTSSGLPGQDRQANILDSSGELERDYVMVEFPTATNSDRATMSSAPQSSVGNYRDSEIPPVIYSAPQPEFYFRVATLMSELASTKQTNGVPEDAFAVLVLGVQLLDKVLSMQKSAISNCLGVDRLRAEMMVAIRQSDELSGNINTDADQSGEMPNPYDAVFQHAICFSQGAAVEELMGNYTRSHTLYERAQDLLWFLAEEAPKLKLEPPMMLSEQERERLHQYMRTIAARIASCPLSRP